MRIPVTITVFLLVTLLGASAYCGLGRGHYFSVSLQGTEVEGDFDGSWILYGGGVVIDVPEVGTGYGVGVGYGFQSSGFLGGGADLRVTSQDAGDYGSGTFNLAGHLILSPLHSRVQPFLKLGACLNMMWVDESRFMDGGSTADTADYTGLGFEVIPGIDVGLSRGDRIRGLRFEFGYRSINYGKVNTVEIDDGLDGTTYLASVSYIHGF